MPFQSTRPLRGATSLVGVGDDNRGISIHAPLAGRDVAVGHGGGGGGISIHAPLAGRDSRDLPAWGFSAYFNPRAPCGARRLTFLNGIDNISFQSTRPLRGATIALDLGGQAKCISIHAPLAGRDIR